MKSQMEQRQGNPSDWTIERKLANFEVDINGLQSDGARWMNGQKACSY